MESVDQKFCVKENKFLLVGRHFKFVYFKYCEKNINLKIISSFIVKPIHSAHRCPLWGTRE